MTKPLSRWIFGITAALAAAHLCLWLLLGRGEPLLALPWFVPMAHSFLALNGICVAILSFGRFKASWEPASFWIGVGFLSYAVLMGIYTLTFPGLFSPDIGIIGRQPSTPAAIFMIAHGCLALSLLAAALANWPRAGVGIERHWLLLSLGLTLAAAVVGLLAIQLEDVLPALIMSINGRPVYSPLQLWLVGALVGAFGLATILAARRYRRTDDRLFGYTALVAVVFAFVMVDGLIGGKRYDFWWYWQRVLTVIGFLVMLVGLLWDYGELFVRERAKADELSELREQAQAERNRLRVLIDTAPTGIVFYTAPDEKVALRNPTASRILGVGDSSPAEVDISSQARYFAVSLPNGQPYPVSDLPSARSLRGETCVGVEMTIRRPDGQMVSLLVNSAPVRDADGQIIGAVVAFQDVTPIKEHEQLRDEFVAAAAHELRAPASLIRGQVSRLREQIGTERPPRESRIVEVIAAQSDRLNRRVQEMLAVVSYRVVAPREDRPTFDLGDLASEVLRRVPAGDRPGRIELERDAPTPVAADRERIADVLTGLIDNARQYSPADGPVAVRVSRVGPDAVVAVRDSGVGIRLERQAHVFEPFYESVPSGAPGYRGIVALSLYLSKLIIDHHGGRIWFESTPGEGSVFYFSLPLAG